MPTVSIVVSTYNRPHLLYRALSKILEQSFEDFEVIVVDDGSDNESRNRLESYRREFDARFRWFELPPRTSRLSNPAVSRNYAMQQAEGRLIAFCDDDDYWSDPSHLGIAVEAFDDHPELDLYFADQIGVLGSDTRIERWQPELPGQLGPPLQGMDKLYQVSRDAFCAHWVPHLNTSVLRAELVRRVGDFWVYTAMEEDVEFLVRCAADARLIVFRDQVVAVHQIPDWKRELNASTRVSQVQRYVFRIAIAHRLRTRTQDPAVLRFARRLELYATQKLALAVREVAPASEFYLSWKGFALHPAPGSLKDLVAALWRRMIRSRVAP